MKALTIAEYIPGRVSMLNRILKLALVLASAGVLLLFGSQLKGLAQDKEACERQLQCFQQYEALMQQGEEAYGRKAYADAEKYYLEAAAINDRMPSPYVRLAEIYQCFRQYDWAVDILEQFPGESEEVAAQRKELQDIIRQQEQSEFVPVS